MGDMSGKDLDEMWDLWRIWQTLEGERKAWAHYEVYGDPES